MLLPVETPPARPAPRRRRWQIVVLVVVAVWSLLQFTAVGEALHQWSLRAVADRGGVPTHSTWRNVRMLVEGTPTRIAALTSGPHVEQIVVDIPFLGMQSLLHKRAAALKEGLLLKEDGDEVDADVRIGARTLRARVRLKGDLLDHLYGDKWSLRIQVRDEAGVLGMTDFAVQHPATKGYVAEAVFLAHCRLRGVLAPSYFFVDVVVNGDSRGRMAVEERPTVAMLEAQRRREGPLLRFDETLRWEAARVMRSDIGFGGAQPLVGAFGEARALRDPKLAADLALAKATLQGVLEGTLPASQAFDTRLWARYLAICEIWGTSHALAWNNLRFHWNPMSARLEPIGFDGNVEDAYYQRLPTLSVAASRVQDGFVADTLEDPLIRSAYFAALREEIAAVQDGSLREALKPFEDQWVAILQAEFPLIDLGYWQHAIARATFLGGLDETNFRTRRLLHPPFPAPTLPRLCHVLLDREADGWMATFVNLVDEAVEVHALVRTDGAPLAAAVTERLPIRLPPSPRGARASQVRIPLLDTDATPPPLRATARIVGNRHDHPVDAQVHVPALRAHPLAPTPTDALLARHAFLSRAESGDLVVPAGDHVVDAAMVLEPGVGLELKAGARVRFARDASLVVRGRLTVAGTEDAPVVLEGRDEVDGRRPWPGVVVFDGVNVDVAHLRIRDTEGHARAGWALTAGFFVAGGDVVMRDTEVSGNRCEDAINLYDCGIDLLRVAVTDTVSDALDLDFCVGNVVDCRFADVGGDGIDVSGADVTVLGGRVTRARDKGISVGERSRLVAEKVVVEESGTGFAVKDGSHGTLRDATLSHLSFAGVMSYVKKPIQGPGTAIVERTLIDAPAERRTIAQTGCVLRVDGVDIPTQDVDVEALYATVMKK